MRKHLLMLMIIMMTALFGLQGQGAVNSDILYEAEAESLPLTGSYQAVSYDSSTNLIRVPAGGTLNLSLSALLDGEGLLYLRGRIIDPQLIALTVNGKAAELSSSGGLSWLALDGGSYSGQTSFNVQIVNSGGVIDIDKVALAKRGAISLEASQPISDIIAGTTPQNGVKLYFSGEELKGSTVAAYRKMTVEGYTNYLRATLGVLAESELAVRIADYLAQPDSRIGEVAPADNSNYSVVDPNPLNGYQCHYYLTVEGGLGKALNSKKITLTYSADTNSVQTLAANPNPAESYLFSSNDGAVIVDDGNLAPAAAGAQLYLDGSETILNLPTFLSRASFLKGKEGAKRAAFSLEQESVVYLYLPEVSSADESYYFKRGYSLLKVPVKLTAAQSCNDSYFFYKRYRPGRADSIYLESGSNERFKSEKIFKTVVEADDLVVYFNDMGTSLDSSYSVTMSALNNGTLTVTGAMTELTPGLWQYRIPNGALTYKGSTLNFSFENEHALTLTNAAWSWNFISYVAAKRQALSAVAFFSPEAEESLAVNFTNEGTAANEGLEHYLTDNGALYGTKGNGRSYGFNSSHNLLSSGVLRGENIKGSYIDNVAGDSLKLELDTTGTIIDSVAGVDLYYSYDGLSYQTLPMSSLGSQKWESSLAIEPAAAKLYFYFSGLGTNYDYQGSSWEWSFYKEKSFTPIYERELAEREYVTLAAEPDNLLINNELINWSIALAKGDYRYRVLVEVDQSAVTPENSRAQIRVNDRIHTIDSAYKGAFELRGEEFITRGMLTISNVGGLPVKIRAVYLNRADNVINSLIHPHYFEWDNNGSYTAIYKELVNLDGTNQIRARFKLVEPAFIEQYAGVERRLELLFNSSSLNGERLIIATDRSFSADSIVAKVVLDREHSSHRVDLSDYTAQIRAAGDWLELHIKSEGAAQLASHYSYVTQFQLDSTVIIDPAAAYQGEGMITKDAQGNYIFTSTGGAESFKSHSSPYNLEQYLNIPVMVKGYKDSPLWLNIFEIKPLIRVLAVTGDNYTNKPSPSWTVDCTPGTTGLRYRVVKETGYQNVTGLSITQAMAREGEHILEIIPMVSYSQGESYSHRFIVDRTGPELTVTETIPVYAKAGAYPVNLSAVDKYSKNLEYYYRVDDRETAAQGIPVKLGATAGDYNVNLPEGPVKLNLYALDELGNSSTLYTKDLTADSTAPTVDIDISYKVIEEAGVKKQTVLALFFENDNLSLGEECKTYYKVGNGSWIEKIEDYVELNYSSFPADGTYYMTAYTIDKAGNRSVDRTVSFIIDTVPVPLPADYDVVIEEGKCKLTWSNVSSDKSFNYYKLRKVPGIKVGENLDGTISLPDNSFLDYTEDYNPDAIYYVSTVDIYGNESPEISCFAMQKKPVTGTNGQNITINMSEPGHQIVLKKSVTSPQYVGMIKNNLNLDENIIGEYGLKKDNIYYFGPHGTVFDEPLIWKIPISDIKSDHPFKKDELTVRYFNWSRNHWETVETVYNSIEDCLEAKIHHFSTYGVALNDDEDKVDLPKEVTTVSPQDGSLNGVIDLISLPSGKGSYELKVDFNSNRYNNISKSLFEHEKLYFHYMKDYSELLSHEYGGAPSHGSLTKCKASSFKNWKASFTAGSDLASDFWHFCNKDKPFEYSKLAQEVGIIDNAWQLNIPKLLKEKPEHNNYKYIKLSDGSEYELFISNGSFQKVNGHKFIFQELRREPDIVQYLVKTPEGKNYLFNKDGLAEVVFYSNSPDVDVLNLDPSRYIFSFHYNVDDNSLERMSSYGDGGEIEYSLYFTYERVPAEGYSDGRYYINRLSKISKYSGILDDNSKVIKEVTLGYTDYPSISTANKSRIFTYNKSKTDKNKLIKVNYKRLSKVSFKDYLLDSTSFNDDINISYRMDKDYDLMKLKTRKLLERIRHRYDVFNWVDGRGRLPALKHEYHTVNVYDEEYLSSGNLTYSPKWNGRIKTLTTLIIDRRNSVEEYDLDDYFRVEDDSFLNSHIYSYCTESRIYQKDAQGEIVDTITNQKYTPNTVYYHYKRNAKGKLTPFTRMVEVREAAEYSKGADDKVTTLKNSSNYYFSETINDPIYGPVDVRSGVISGAYDPLAFAAYENDVVPADGSSVTVKELSDVLSVESYSRKRAVMGWGNRLYSSTAYVKNTAFGEELIQSYMEQDYTPEDNLKTKREYINSNDFKQTDYTYTADQGADSLYLNPKVATVTEELSSGVTLSQVNTYDKTGSGAGIYRLTKSVVSRTGDTNKVANHYEYDANDRLIKEVRSDSDTAVNGLTKTYLYDILGNVIEAKVSGTTILNDNGIIKEGNRTMVTKSFYGSMSNRLRAVKEYEVTTIGTVETKGAEKVKLFYYDDKGRVYRTVTLHYAAGATSPLAKADVESKFFNEHAGTNVGNMLFATGSWVDMENSSTYSEDIKNLSPTGGVYTEVAPTAPSTENPTPTPTTDQVVYTDYETDLGSLKTNKFDFRLSTTGFIAASYSLHYGGYVLKQVEYKKVPGAANNTATKRELTIKVDSRGKPLTKTTDSGLIYSYEYDNMGSLKKEIFPTEAAIEPIFYAKHFEKYGMRSYKFYNGTQYCQPEEAQYYEMSQTDGLGRTVYTRKKSADSENPIDIVESVKYDNSGKPLVRTGPNGEREVTTYNLFGVVDKTVTAVDGTKLVTEWNSYDSFGNSTKEYSEIAMNSKIDMPLTEKLYDRFGQVIKETIKQDSAIIKSGLTATDVTVERAYNRQGQPILEVSNMYTEPKLNRTEYKYNDYGLPSEKTYYTLDPADKISLIKYVEKTGYDGYRRVEDQSTDRIRMIDANTEGTAETISRTLTAGYNNDGEVTIQYSISEGSNWVKTVNTYNDNNQIIRTDLVTLANSNFAATAAQLGNAAALRTLTSYTQYDDIYRESITQGADGTLSKVTYNSRGLKDKEYSGLKLTGALSESLTGGKIESTVDTTQAIPTEYIYNKAGLLIKEKMGTLYEKSTDYDSLGRKVKEISNPNTEKELVTEYSYDKLGRELKVRSGHILTEVLSWETGPDKTKEIRTTITDSTGSTIYKSYTESELYSVMGNLVESRDRDGYIYRERVNGRGETVYSSKSIMDNGVEKVIKSAVNDYLNSIHTGGTITKVTTGTPNIIEETVIGYTYTNKGETASLTTNRKRTEGTAITTEPAVVKTFTYTRAGQVESETVTAGADARTISYTYEPTGELKELTYPDGSIKRPTYDQATGRIKSLKHNAREIISGVEYNQNTAYTYKTGEGLNAITKKYSFNDLMQIEQIDYNSGTFSQNYSYDKAGNITEIKEIVTANNPLVKTAMNRTYSYDSRNRLTKANYTVAQNSTRKILYQLNPKVSYQENDYYPKRAAINKTTPLDVDIQKGAPSIILEGRNNSDIKPDFIRIDKAGLNQLVDGRQINLLYQNAAGGFDRLDETLAQYTISSNDNYFDLDIKEEFVAKAFKLNFEPNRMNSSQQSLDSGTTKKLAELAQYYSYATDMEISYTYDHFDNRESVTNRLSKGGTLLETESNSYKYSLDKKLLESDNTFSYQYDVEGNLIKKAEKGESTNYWQYIWSADGYLIRVDKYKGNAIIFTEQYVYDESGIRLQSIGGEESTRYVYDGSELIFESTVKGAETTEKKMVYALGELQAVISGAGATEEATYYHSDVIGSTRFTTNANWVSNDFIFDPFGNEELVGTTTYNGESNYYTFAGHVPKNEQTGLTYMKARWMDNASGRFISRDPAKDGMNWYVYCGNNPTTMIDPTGLAHESVEGAGNSLPRAYRWDWDTYDYRMHAWNTFNMQFNPYHYWGLDSFNASLGSYYRAGAPLVDGVNYLKNHSNRYISGPLAAVADGFVKGMYAVNDCGQGFAGLVEGFADYMNHSFSEYNTAFFADYVLVPNSPYNVLPPGIVYENDYEIGKAYKRTMSLVLNPLFAGINRLNVIRSTSLDWLFDDFLGWGLNSNDFDMAMAGGGLPWMMQWNSAALQLNTYAKASAGYNFSKLINRFGGSTPGFFKYGDETLLYAMDDNPFGLDEYADVIWETTKGEYVYRSTARLKKIFKRYPAFNEDWIVPMQHPPKPVMDPRTGKMGRAWGAFGFKEIKNGGSRPVIYLYPGANERIALHEFIHWQQAHYAGITNQAQYLKWLNTPGNRDLLEKGVTNILINFYNWK